jgi:hypothetical protein
MTPRLVDLDGDGDHDMVIGDNDTSVYVAENTGSMQQPRWGTAVAGWSPPTAASTVSHTEYVDFDNDGDPDVLIGGAGAGAIISRYTTSTSTYAASGTYTSAVLDFGYSSYTTLNYTTNIRTGTALTVDVRAGNSAVPDGSWTAWQRKWSTAGRRGASGVSLRFLAVGTSSSVGARTSTKSGPNWLTTFWPGTVANSSRGRTG